MPRCGQKDETSMTFTNRPRRPGARHAVRAVALPLTPPSSLWEVAPVAVLCWGLVVGLLVSACGIGAAEERPNIIVFYTDDHGHADLSCQGVLDDVRTPHVDSLARHGVLARHGYSTAPQCVPSRAGLLVGRFQSKFGVESNGNSLDGFDRAVTIAERLQQAGYVTAQFGKWHLGPGSEIVKHGFKHVFNQNAQRPFAANITITGEDRDMSNCSPELYHVDACSRAAASLIQRYRDDPFFLYVAYRAPHVPLDAPQKYLDRFPGKMPERRRQALAMLSAVDDGVGLINETLRKTGLREQTLIFYIGDNGAPLKIHKLDAPGGGPGWDGSLNDPLNGEKGMLTEGGMHVPFVVCWPGTIPGGQVYQHPVSALDVAATAAALANVAAKPGDLDGVNLIPHLTGQTDAPPHAALMWRWVSQSAIRQGDWKLLRGGDREYLFNLEADLEEKMNLVAQHPEIASRLRASLASWANTLEPPGLSTATTAKVWNDYFDYYLDGKPAPPLRSKIAPRTPPNSPASTASEARPPAGFQLRTLRGWIARNGELTAEAGVLRLTGREESKAPFLVRTRLKLSGPLTATMQIKAATTGRVAIAWRTSQQPEFSNEAVAASTISAANQWETLTIELPVEGELIHLRIHTPPGVTTFREIKLDPASGKSAKLW